MLLHIGDVKDLKRENLLISEKAHIVLYIPYNTHTPYYTLYEGEIFCLMFPLP